MIPAWGTKIPWCSHKSILYFKKLKKCHLLPEASLPTLVSPISLHLSSPHSLIALNPMYNYLTCPLLSSVSDPHVTRSLEGSVHVCLPSLGVPIAQHATCPAASLYRHCLSTELPASASTLCNSPQLPFSSNSHSLSSPRPQWKNLWVILSSINL